MRDCINRETRFSTILYEAGIENKKMYARDKESILLGK